MLKKEQVTKHSYTTVVLKPMTQNSYFIDDRENTACCQAVSQKPDDS